MSRVTTVSIPESLLERLIQDYAIRRADKTSLIASVKALIEHAALNGVTPKAVEDGGPSIMMGIRVAEPAASAIQARATATGLTLGPYCKQLLGGLDAAQGQTPDLAPMNIESGLLGDVVALLHQQNPMITPRNEQSIFYMNLCHAMADGGIGLCEAGTGTGKTLAVLVAAIDFLKKHALRLVIATPTIAVMREFAATYLPIEALVADAPPLRPVLGRREFVSVSAIQEILHSGQYELDITCVHDWLASGGSPPSSPQHGAIQIPWLASSLEALCPEFPLDEARLSDVVSTGDPGYQAYRRQFSESRDAAPEILLCTHAMLAADMRSRQRLATGDDEIDSLRKEIKLAFAQIKAAENEGVRNEAISNKNALRQIEAERIMDLSEDRGLLPAYSALIVDESHLLESNFSSALSEYVSLRALLRQLHDAQACGVPLKAAQLRTVKSAIDRIQSTVTTDDLIRLSNPSAAAITEAISDITEAIARIPAPSTMPSAETALHAYQLHGVARILRSALKARNLAYLKASPIRAYPQIYLGRSSVESILSTLWSGMTAGAAVSATLYLKKGDGYSANYQRSILAIPEARAKEFAPVAPAWLISTVAGAWTPEPVTNSRGLWLRPPTQSDRLTESVRKCAEVEWLKEVAEVLLSIHSTAIGGTLVLMTSYESASILHSLLPDVTKEASVVASPNKALPMQARHFLRLSHSGQRPLWIAVGGAWTGLDIGGGQSWERLFGAPLDSEADNVLTDLVIPRIPYGINQTITHVHRMERNPGVPWEMIEASFRLLQGLGRLVRRSGLQSNRRIFMLDGRLNDPKFANMTSSIRSALARYKSFVLKRGKLPTAT